MDADDLATLDDMHTSHILATEKPELRVIGALSVSCRLNTFVAVIILRS